VHCERDTPGAKSCKVELDSKYISKHEPHTFLLLDHARTLLPTNPNNGLVGVDKSWGLNFPSL